MRRLSPILPELLFVAVTAIILLGASVSRADPDARQEVRLFEQQIRPVLSKRCVKCHGPDKQEGNLRLDSASAVHMGGDSGSSVVAGQPDQSLLIQAIRYSDLEMPPDEPLSETQIQNFQAWIARGAVWPKQIEAIRPASGRLSDADRDWWAIQPLIRPDIPTLKENDGWAKNPIDHFVRRRLAEREMQPAPRADRSTLVRRLYFTLIGLPPSPEEIERFVADDSPTAWEDLIDTLLADVRYGEHWARYWLDLVRFAESDGWKADAFRPRIWRYRDYVVRSFNQDRPYDEFVRQQLAGDEMPADDPENLAATGYLRLGIYEYNQRNARTHWNDILNEMTDVTSDVFLGVGLACARCHDHKFDPLLQADYYQLRAFFEPVVWSDDAYYASGQQRMVFEQQQAAWRKETAEVHQQIDELVQPFHDRKLRATLAKFPLDIQACLDKPLSERTSWDQQMSYLIERQIYEEGTAPVASMKGGDKKQYESLMSELKRFDHVKPTPPPQLMAAADFSGPISPTVIPGTGQIVEPGFPAILLASTLDEPPVRPLSASSGRRTALARWIGQADNPLTTRVIVNRIWQQHFGRGIVETPSDFGRLGQPPSHPQLLDWLTTQFLEHGWSIKRLHKTILMSATWQQSAEHAQAGDYQQRDPSESLLWRLRIRRLRAEQIRDRMLFASGELASDLGGPSVDGDVPRRSLYVKSFRNNPHPMLHAFDMANGLKSVAERNTTTTPIQSLMMINGDYVLQRAQRMAARLMKAQWRSSDAMLVRGFRLAWGRGPTESELTGALLFVTPESDSRSAAVDSERLTDFCHVLLNANEFLYVD